jgi:hypothetical protein
MGWIEIVYKIGATLVTLIAIFRFIRSEIRACHVINFANDCESDCRRSRREQATLLAVMPHVPNEGLRQSGRENCTGYCGTSPKASVQMVA